MEQGATSAKQTQKSYRPEDTKASSRSKQGVWVQLEAKVAAFGDGWKGQDGIVPARVGDAAIRKQINPYTLPL
eukprot:6474416-Amphidinium_carterae.1